MVKDDIIKKFMKVRSKIRPYRIDTLLNKPTSRVSDLLNKTPQSLTTKLSSLFTEELENEENEDMDKIAENIAITSKNEFAPGIPKERVIKPLPIIKREEPNQTWKASLSLHPATRRGDHHDLRLVDPEGRAHSWAIDNLPENNKSTYAVQMATHSKSYALRKKPFSIPEGYGATRPGALVQPKFVGNIEVVESSPNTVRFLKHEGQQTKEFILRQVAPSTSRDSQPIWVLHNATKTRNTIEGQKIPSTKPTYKEQSADKIDFGNSQQIMSPKIDGAHVLVHFSGENKIPRVYSYRPTSREGGLIEHTFKLPDIQSKKYDPSLKNTLIRAEIYGTDKSGKAIPVEQLSGILNAGTLKSRELQNQKGINLRLAGIDVVKYQGKNVENKPFSEKLQVLQQVNKLTDNHIELLPYAKTEKEKQQLLESVQNKKHPITEEGVVLHELNDSKNIKVKFRPDYDVYVRKVFTKEKSETKGHAGGFEYSWSPDGPIVGRTGTGFNHALKKDMLQNPDKYIGAVATVKSQQVYGTKGEPGALRAPSFVRWHADKNDPEILEKK